MSLSKRMRFQVLMRDNFRCRYCGRTGSAAELHVDHIKPKALGGSDDPDNLCAACRDCNLGKSSTDARSPDEVVAAILRENAAFHAQYRDEFVRIRDRYPKLSLEAFALAHEGIDADEGPTFGMASIHA